MKSRKKLHTHLLLLLTEAASKSGLSVVAVKEMDEVMPSITDPKKHFYINGFFNTNALVNVAKTEAEVIMGITLTDGVNDLRLFVVIEPDKKNLYSLVSPDFFMIRVVDTIKVGTQKTVKELEEGMKKVADGLSVEGEHIKNRNALRNMSIRLFEATLIPILSL